MPVKNLSFSDIGIGEIQSYTLYNDNGNKRRIFRISDAKLVTLLSDTNPFR